MMKTLITLFAVTITGGALANAQQGNPDATLNTAWNSVYESAGGRDVDAKIILKKKKDENFGSGKYETEYGNGTLSQVRTEIGERQQTPERSGNGPLPGPDSPNAGATDVKAVYIKGVWDFDGTTGWFSWELYEQGRKCKFKGKWGFLNNGQAGPVKGVWNGTLSGGGNGGTTSNGPVITIPF